MVISVLAVLSSSLFSQSINESSMVERYLYTNEALWVAEAGLAEAIVSLPGTLNTTQNGSLRPNYDYSVLISIDVYDDGNSHPPFCRLDSTGTVTVPGVGATSRTIRAIVRVNSPQDFNRAIEITGDLVIKGAAHTITGENGVPNDMENAVNEGAALDFAAIFGLSKADMKANADHLYDEVTFGAPVTDITWVDVTPGNTLAIAGNLVGSGILIVNGDTDISGSVVFSGIIYIIGELSLAGTPDIFGSILAESGADIDTSVAGNVEITWNEEAINQAVGLLNALTAKDIMAWYEI